MKNLKTRLHEIIATEAQGLIDDDHVQREGRTKAVNQLLSLFQKEVEGIMGADEEPKSIGSGRIFGRNKLRAEQRQKLEELMKG